MPTSGTAAALAATFVPPPQLQHLSSGATRIPLTLTRKSNSRSLKFSCQVAVTTDDVSSPASSLSDEELEAASKAGKRIKVKVPLKVYHVPKAPDLDLNGMEGVIKQYVGVWKGKRISANLPFKVEFFASVEGQDKPVRFFAHLKEDEFDYLEDV